jgi:predicted ATP-dependent endonuclease of OLD family
MLASNMDDAKELIATIHKIKSNGLFKKYIDFIQFPFFRNIEVNTRITFEFPLTVFIGQNGCGKSSCLHAIYGAPQNNTPGEFWFETKLDPVEYYDDQKKRHSFWYSYADDAGVQREVIKARIRREGNPNYWETSRPLSWAGMKPRLNRDKTIQKNVIYLDFRAELSAFDKYFYFGDLKNSKARNKQEFIRTKSSSLKNLFDGKKEQIRSKRRSLNGPVEEFSEEETKHISSILGRKYAKGKSVLHQLYRSEGYSVMFETGFAKYSEAFAGSGEVAVVRLVREVLAAPPYSLILLDEPEVSLHPVRCTGILRQQILYC